MPDLESCNRKNAAMRYTEEQMKLLLTVQDMIKNEMDKLINHKPINN